MGLSGRIGVVALVGAAAMAWVFAPGGAWAEDATPPPAVAETGAADVVIEGVTFEASLGLSAADIEALVASCRDSLSVMVTLPQELQDRINAVIVARDGGDQ